MKKITIILLAIVLTFALTACGGAQKGLTVQEGTLRVGMDLQYPPFETFDENNDPMGISVDVAQAFADELGLELEVVNMDFGALMPALETGDIDIAIASMSITKEREEKVDFSDPYFYFKIIGLMNKDYAAANGLGDHATADDLWGIDDTQFVGIAGQISTTIPQQNGFDVMESLDKSAAITEITTGSADMLIISPEVVVGANQAHPDTTQVFWPALDTSPIGMAVAEGNSALLEKADMFIDGMDDEGQIYDQLRKKYDSQLTTEYGEGFNMDFYIYE